MKHELALIDFKVKLIAATKSMECANLSVIACMRYAISVNCVSVADSMAKAFKVQDKRLWRVKVSALAESGNWEVLEDFGDKKSPIGYAPFVEACMVNHNTHEAEHFALKISDTEERLHCALKWQLYAVAIQCATKLKDTDTLMRIIGESRMDDIKRQAREAITLIEGGKK